MSVIKHASKVRLGWARLNSNKPLSWTAKEENIQWNSAIKTIQNEDSSSNKNLIFRPDYFFYHFLPQVVQKEVFKDHFLTTISNVVLILIFILFVHLWRMGYISDTVHMYSLDAVGVAVLNIPGSCIFLFFGRPLSCHSNPFNGTHAISYNNNSNKMGCLWSGSVFKWF